MSEQTEEKDGKEAKAEPARKRRGAAEVAADYERRAQRIRWKDARDALERLEEARQEIIAARTLSPKLASPEEAALWDETLKRVHTLTDGIRKQIPEAAR